MPYVTPYTFVALATLTAAQLNGIQSNIAALWPYTAAGDIPYTTAADTLAKLAKGTVHQKVKMNAGASAPEWGTDLIQEQILAEAAASVTFSNIPDTYKHLKLIFFGRYDLATPSVYSMNVIMRLNGDTASGHYDYQTMGRIGTTSTGAEGYGAGISFMVPFDFPTANSPTGACGFGEILFPGYSGTDFFKTSLSQFGIFKQDATGGFAVEERMGIWEDTAAISSITLTYPGSNTCNIVAGSSFGIYGII